MANEINNMVISAKEFTMNFTLSGTVTNDLNFSQVTIPGKADATTEEIKLNHSNKKVITSPGTFNDFTFTTKFTPATMAWTQAADKLATYSVVLSGDAGGAFAGDTIEISGHVLGIDDKTIGMDGTPDAVFKGATEYFKYTPHQ